MVRNKHHEDSTDVKRVIITSGFTKVSIKGVAEDIQTKTSTRKTVDKFKISLVQPNVSPSASSTIGARWSYLIPI